MLNTDTHTHMLVNAEKRCDILNGLRKREQEHRDYTWEQLYRYTSGDSLLYVNDIDFVLLVVKNINNTLQYASLRLRDNNEIVSTAVNKTGLSLEHASLRLQNNRGIVLSAVKQTGSALMYASTRLQNDHEIVLSAVTQDRYALKYASDELKNIYLIVETAINQAKIKFGVERYDEIEYNYGKFELFQKKKFDEVALEFASKELQCNKSIVLNAIEYQPNAILFAAEHLQHNREFIIEAVKKNGSVILHLNEKFTSDTEIILNAIYQNRDLLDNYLRAKFFELPGVMKSIQENILFVIKCYPVPYLDSSEMFRITKNYDFCVNSSPLGLAKITVKIFFIISCQQTEKDYSCKCRFMSGNEFKINISKKTTFNSLAIMIYELPEFKTEQLQNIIFVYEDTVFDLNNYKDNVVGAF